ncbi:MAG: BACON domain-containing protein, partial [Alistipes sp.]|nr:BACON domain-containing protein [Alistipes sp.]
MKSIFRSLLLAAVALTAGFAVSCTENGDEGQHYEGTPTITVSPSKVSIGLEGGTTEAVTITTPAEWTITIDTEGVTASSYAGFGDATVTFEVSEASAMRNINAVVTATGYVSGFPISKKATVIIAQSNIISGTTIYSENCGSAVSKVDGYWPEVNSYSGWSKTGGEGYDQSGVTYTGKSSSIRDSKKEWAPVGATYASDAPYAYMKDGSEFTISNITINNKVKSYIFSFTGHNQYANLIESPYSPASVSPLKSGENLTVSVSVDGTNWGNIAFETMPDGNWEYAIAPFTLPAEADKLYVKFSGYKSDTTTPLPDATYQYQAALRFDDFCLVEGGYGPVVEFSTQGGGSDNPGSGTMPENISTIAEILALGDGATIPATAIEGIVISSLELNNLTSKKGMYVQDATGALQFYLAANHEFAYGTKVKIDLTGATLGAYNGAVQISGLALDKVVAVSTGNTVEAKTVKMEDFLANKYEGQYVAIEGVQVVADDMSKTWVVGGAHTSLNFEDAAGNTFVVFSSKY